MKFINDVYNILTRKNSKRDLRTAMLNYGDSLPNEIVTNKIQKAFDNLEELARETKEVAKAVSISINEKISESDLRLGKILNNIEDLILVKDGAGRWKMLNNKGCLLLGLSTDQYFNKTDDEIKLVRPNFNLTLDSSTISDNLAWTQGSTIRHEESFRCEETTLTFDITKTPLFNEDGSRKELIIVGRDITDVKERQKRMRAAYQALNLSSELISIIDQNGDIIFANDKFLESYEYDNFKEICGKPMSVIKNGVSAAELNTMWNHIKNNKMWHGRIKNKTKKQNVLIVDTTILPIMNGEPTPIFYICKQTIV